MCARKFGRYFWANKKADGAVHRLKLKIMIPSRSLWFQKSRTGGGGRMAPPSISLEPLRYAWNLRIEVNILIRINENFHYELIALIKLSDSEDYLRSGKPNFHCFWLCMFVCMYARKFGRYFWANYKSERAVHRLKLKIMVPSGSLWFQKSHTGEGRRTPPLPPFPYLWSHFTTPETFELNLIC